VKSKTERQKGKPDRHIYSITKKGRERWWKWLAVKPQPEIPRNELLLKLFFGAQASPEIADRIRGAHGGERERGLFKEFKRMERKNSPKTAVPRCALTGRWRRASGSWNLKRTCAGRKRRWTN
jgi:DNA-binding PadR family transcriptional regulator